MDTHELFSDTYFTVLLKVVVEISDKNFVSNDLGMN
jgi:hypothetical protein